MKITQHGEFREYQPEAGESAVLHDGQFIASRIGAGQSAAPGRRYQIIQGKTAEVDAEIARLGLRAPTAADREAVRVSHLTDEQLAAEKAKADATKAAVDAEVAKRPGLAEAKA